jgi:hypothetical protein
MPGFDLKQINRNDQGILGAGILFLLLSFFVPFWSVSVKGLGGLGGGSASWTAWHSYGFLGVLLVLVAVGIVAARVLANASLPSLPIGPNLLVVALSTLGTLLLLLRGFTYKSGSALGFSYGLDWGAYVIFVLGIAVAVFAFLNFKASGEKMAWDATATNKPVAAGEAPPATPYPPQSAPTYPPTAPADPAYPADPGTPGV